MEFKFWQLMLSDWNWVLNSYAQFLALMSLVHLIGSFSVYFWPLKSVNQKFFHHNIIYTKGIYLQQTRGCMSFIPFFLLILTISFSHRNSNKIYSLTVHVDKLSRTIQSNYQDLKWFSSSNLNDVQKAVKNE